MKQTAVQWLIDNLVKNDFIGTFCQQEEVEKKREEIAKIIHQAKEMEKEQMSEFYFSDRDFCSGGVTDETFESQYDYIFKGIIE